MSDVTVIRRLSTSELSWLCGKIETANENGNFKDLETYLKRLACQIKVLAQQVTLAIAREYNDSRGPLLYSSGTDDPKNAAKTIRTALKHGPVYAYFSPAGKDSGDYRAVLDVRAEKGQLRLKGRGFIGNIWSTHPPIEVWGAIGEEATDDEQ